MKAKLLTMLVVTVIVTGLLALAWYGMLKVPPNTARLWALLVTLLLPLFLFGGYYFGHVEARGRLAGIDQALDKTFVSLSQAAKLQVGTTRAMRQVAQDPYVVLPEVEIVQRRLPSGREVIEL